MSCSLKVGPHALYSKQHGLLRRASGVLRKPQGGSPLGSLQGKRYRHARTRGTHVRDWRAPFPTPTLASCVTTWHTTTSACIDIRSTCNNAGRLTRSYGELQMRSKFCLAPHGSGFGMRLTIAITFGCIPVIIQVRKEACPACDCNTVVEAVGCRSHALYAHHQVG